MRSRKSACGPWYRTPNGWFGALAVDNGFGPIAYPLSLERPV